jgi:hypothetical protein
MPRCPDLRHPLSLRCSQGLQVVTGYSWDRKPIQWRWIDCSVHGDPDGFLYREWQAEQASIQAAAAAAAAEAQRIAEAAHAAEVARQAYEAEVARQAYEAEVARQEYEAEVARQAAEAAAEAARQQAAAEEEAARVASEKAAEEEAARVASEKAAEEEAARVASEKAAEEARLDKEAGKAPPPPRPPKPPSPPSPPSPTSSHPHPSRPSTSSPPPPPSELTAKLEQLALRKKQRLMDRYSKFLASLTTPPGYPAPPSPPNLMNGAGLRDLDCPEPLLAGEVGTNLEGYCCVKVGRVMFERGGGGDLDRRGAAVFSSCCCGRYNDTLWAIRWRAVRDGENMVKRSVTHSGLVACWVQIGPQLSVDDANCVEAGVEGLSMEEASAPAPYPAEAAEAALQLKRQKRKAAAEKKKRAEARAAAASPPDEEPMHGEHEMGLAGMPLLRGHGIF